MFFDNAFFYALLGLGTNLTSNTYFRCNWRRPNFSSYCICSLSPITQKSHEIAFQKWVNVLVVCGKLTA